MLLITLMGLWKNVAGGLSPLEDRVEFAAFEVTDTALADKLRLWEENDQTATLARNQFLDEISPQYMRPSQLQYHLDVDGHLERIAFCGCTPNGWNQAIIDSSWLKPDTRDAIAAVGSLPLSSRRVLHDMIGWPTINPRHFDDERHVALAHWVNKIVRLEEKDGKIFIHAPHPNNFIKTCPAISKKIRDWNLPAGIRRHENSVPRLQP